MLGEFIIRLLMLILGYAYPAFECFKTVEKNKVEIEELRFWCQYWVPMYGELKLTLLIYLWYPTTKGSDYVYDTLLRPYMARHGTQVDKKVQEVRARAWDFALYYWQNCTELGQSKFFEMLQYLAGQSSSLKLANQKSDKKNSNIPQASGKSKENLMSTNHSVVESAKSKFAQFLPESQSEYEQSSIPDSHTQHSRLPQFLNFRHTKSDD